MQYLWEKHHTFLLELVKLPVAKAAWYLPLALFSLLYHHTELLKLKFATLTSALGRVFWNISTVIPQLFQRMSLGRISKMHVVSVSPGQCAKDKQRAKIQGVLPAGIHCSLPSARRAHGNCSVSLETTSGSLGSGEDRGAPQQTDRQRVWTLLPLEIQIYLDKRDWQEKRREARPCLPPPYTMTEQWGSPSVHLVSTSVASWPRCYMVTLGSHNHSGVLLEAENCFNQSTWANGVGIPSTVISAAA